MNKVWKILGCLTVGMLLMSTMPAVVAELPPELIKEKNSEAEEILVGTVLGTYNAPNNWVYPHETSERLKYFKLKIEEVQKTAKGLEKGDVIKVVFVDYGLKSSFMVGENPIRVNLLEKIKVYANPTDFENNIFGPAIGAYSIEILGYNYYYLMILGAVIGIILGSIYLIIKSKKVKLGGENYEED